MNGTVARRGTGVGLGHTQGTQTLFAQTMWLVAVTTGIFAFGAYVGQRPVNWLGFGVLYRRVCLPDRHEVRRTGIEFAGSSLVVAVRVPHRVGDSADNRVSRARARRWFGRRGELRRCS